MAQWDHKMKLRNKHDAMARVRDDGNNGRLAYRADHRIEAEHESPMAVAERQESRAKLVKALGTLTYKQRKVMKLRYGLADGYVYSMAEVGRIFKVTKERVRQLEMRAIFELGRLARVNGLMDYRT